jgi:hypothetical protein
MYIVHTKSNANRGPHPVTVAAPQGPVIPVFAAGQDGKEYVKAQGADRYWAVSRSEARMTHRRHGFLGLFKRFFRT